MGPANDRLNIFPRMPSFVRFALFVVNLPAGFRVNGGSPFPARESCALPGKKTENRVLAADRAVNRKPFALPRKTVGCSVFISLNMSTGKN